MKATLRYIILSAVLVAVATLSASDTTLNRFVARGTTAQKNAFTPSAPTPASGPSPGYVWFDTDLAALYCYDFGGAAWVACSAAGTGTVTNTGALAANALVKGNGGVDVSTITTGTGILTALGVNVGTAGSPVVNGGALGTPSSGTLTNATGLPLAGLATPPPGTELDYVEFTSPVSPTATTEGTANTVITGSSVAYDGATIVLIEFFSQNSRPTASAGASLNFWLYEDGSSIGNIGTITAAGASAANSPVRLIRRITPSNASHTYSIRASVSSGTGLVNAGAGGNGNVAPGFIRITRK